MLEELLENFNLLYAEQRVDRSIIVKISSKRNCSHQQVSAEIRKLFMIIAGLESKPIYLDSIDGYWFKLVRPVPCNNAYWEWL